MLNSSPKNDISHEYDATPPDLLTREQEEIHRTVTLTSFSDWSATSDKSPDKMVLYVDDREPNSVIEAAREVAELTEILFKVKRLPLGDFLIIDPNDKAIVVERKAISDFITSVRSNHLWQQLLEIMRNGHIFNHPIKRCMLLVQGIPSEFFYSTPHDKRKNDRTGLWGQTAGAMQEALFVYNMPICPIENHQDALKSFLKITINREKQGKNDKLPQGRWHRKPKGSHLPKKNLKHHALASIPLIGGTLAKTLLDHFKNIQNIANATIKDLQEVHGIGKKKAEKIHMIFH